MRGLGDCRFERANEAWGFDGGDAWTTAFAATWEQGATWPTLALGTYIDRREEGFPWGSCTDNRLYRPAGEGRGFAPPLPLTPELLRPLHALHRLEPLRHAGPARLQRPRVLQGRAGAALAPRPRPAAGALHRSRRLEEPAHLGHGHRRRRPRRRRLPGILPHQHGRQQAAGARPPDGRRRPTYADVAFPRGVTAHRPYTGGEIRPSTAWHAAVRGREQRRPRRPLRRQGQRRRHARLRRRPTPTTCCCRRADGTFREAGDVAGVASTAHRARRRARRLQPRRRRPTSSWSTAARARSSGEHRRGPGHWLQLRPRRDGANPDAVGGWIEVRCAGVTLRRELTVGGGHAGGQSGWWHFGIGAETAADVRILWPDGTAGDWQRVAADGFYVVDPSGAQASWDPALTARKEVASRIPAQFQPDSRYRKRSLFSSLAPRPAPYSRNRTFPIYGRFRFRCA